MRMTAYISRALRLDAGRALELREHYFHETGATVVGLARDHGIDARDFMLDVHDVDYSVLAPDPELASLVERLPGRKIIFTNGGGGHAQRALQALGLDHVFHAVFDLDDSDYAPKPQREAYARLIAAHAINTHAAILIEDTMKNLEPAFELGFATALVGPVHPEPRPAYVHHWAHDVKTLLRTWATGH
jgi:putative hydrolase of the HAD superfamily